MSLADIDADIRTNFDTNFIWGDADLGGINFIFDISELFSFDFPQVQSIFNSPVSFLNGEQAGGMSAVWAMALVLAIGITVAVVF